MPLSCVLWFVNIGWILQLQVIPWFLTPQPTPPRPRPHPHPPRWSDRFRVSWSKPTNASNGGCTRSRLPAVAQPSPRHQGGRGQLGGGWTWRDPQIPSFLGGTILDDFWDCYFFGWNPALFDHHIRQMLQRSSKNGIPVKEWCFLDARCRAVGAMIVCEQFCCWTKVIWTFMDIYGHIWTSWKIIRLYRFRFHLISPELTSKYWGNAFSGLTLIRPISRRWLRPKPVLPRVLLKVPSSDGGRVGISSHQAWPSRSWALFRLVWWCLMHLLWPPLLQGPT